MFVMERTLSFEFGCMNGKRNVPYKKIPKKYVQLILHKKENKNMPKNWNEP